MIRYENDFYSWANEQAQPLKSSLFGQLDIANLVEEIETMGRSEKRELENGSIVLLAHLLKRQHTNQSNEAETGC